MNFPENFTSGINKIKDFSRFDNQSNMQAASLNCHLLHHSYGKQQEFFQQKQMFSEISNIKETKTIDNNQLICKKMLSFPLPIRLSIA